jgi:uncharacterized repeat protein (TIGR03803 family)
MRQKNSWFNASTALAVMGMALVLTPSLWAASTSKILHRFMGADGARPFAGLILDAAGNLYGTTREGGSHHQGTVFRLKPNPDGTWTESVLHSFGAGTDGSNPSAPLIFDAAGNLYGTTEYGGGSSACNGGCGVVFKLQPNSSGSWTESVLHRFANVADGAFPFGSLVFDVARNLYGTTGGGGGGTVFRLEPNSDGSWTESVLYRFTGGTDGAIPIGSLIFDAEGKNLYGMTQQGGGGACGIGCGTVFRLEPNSDGSWTESVLYRFTGGTDGAFPTAGSLIFDAAGNLYGMTGVGGCPTCGAGGSGCGTVFRLKANADGSWTESVIHRFDNRSGASPNAAGLTSDVSGNLYGTTSGGGSTNCAGGGCGTVFRLKPNSNGWTYSVLHYFFGEPAETPIGNLVPHNTVLSLYGTTVNCGTNISCKGVVFEITP